MGRTRVAIVEGVAHCIVARGVRRTTMIDIANAAGIAKGTLYNHIRTRNEAYVLLAASETERLISLLDGGGANDSGAAATGALGRERRLLAVAEAVAAHPVVRALAATEPDVLVTALVYSSHGGTFQVELRAALSRVLGEAVAGLALRWLLSLLLDPGSADERARTVGQLVRLAEDPAVDGGGGDYSAGPGPS